LATVDPDRRQRPLDLFGLVLPDSQEPGADREWFDRVGRHGASPSTARRYLEAAIGFDVREEVTKITAPTIVIHNRGDQLIDVAEARELAALIPGARLVERDRPEHVMFSGDASDLVSEIERFVTGSTGRRRRASAPEGWDSLTPAELRVTKLVAQGKSNAEIAATLFITTETVKSHVAAALRKTASASRTILSSRYHSQFRDT
ncbi:MAG: LuxR C-terminal-related transcriptional regulator, partial [Mycobacteriales bacterium]